MQGDQYSPGIIPLAIKDVFSMIQDVSFLVNLIIYVSLLFIIILCEVLRMSLYPFPTLLSESEREIVCDIVSITLAFSSICGHLCTPFSYLHKDT